MNDIDRHWAPTAILTSIYVNAHLKEGKQPTTFEDFMPRGGQKRVESRDNMPAFDDMAARFMNLGANVVTTKKPE